MSYIDSELVDIKLFGASMGSWTLPPVGQHINYMTFARYFIPSFVKEDKVLYLDSDTIVTRDLTELFEIDLTDKPLAASKVIYGLEDRFNAGVLLINNQYWREYRIQEQAIDITEREHEHLAEADQTVLNMIVGHDYIQLGDEYNFQIGYDQIADMRNQTFIFDFPLDPLPAIIHYLSADKPWNTFSVGRLREIWWKYSQMEWLEIIVKNTMCAEKNKNIKHALTFTNSQSLENILDLIHALPDVVFHIVTFTDMGEILRGLSSYENIRLYPNVMKWRCHDLINKSDVYLDINHENKFPDMIEFVQEAKKPILSFDTTSNPFHVDYVFSSDEPSKMIAFIKGLS